jgi:hypothetical protein
MSEDNNGGNGNGGGLIPDEPADLRALSIALVFKPLIRGGQVITGADPTTEEGFACYMAMKHGQVEAAEGMHDKVLPLVNFLIEAKRKVDADSGEITIYPRFVLLCEDGAAYGGGATTMMGCIADLLLSRPQLPWTPPFKVRLIKKKLPARGFAYGLLPVYEAKEKKGGGNGPKAKG